MSLLPTILFCAVATIALIAADRSESNLGRWLTKPFASAAFVAIALQGGALDSAYGVTVLVALLLCMLGDLLLIPEAVGPLFLAGLVSFLLGHLAFGVAFVVLGVSWGIVGLSALVLAVPALFILRWLRPHLEGPMRAAVPTYILVICAMVALSLGAAIPARAGLIAAGTICFFLSDIAVARNRFVQTHWHNRLWGLPLYYGATVMLALTVQP
jgi:uncharacterized membrane protein YhhN